MPPFTRFLLSDIMTHTLEDDSARTYQHFVKHKYLFTD